MPRPTRWPIPLRAQVDAATHRRLNELADAQGLTLAALIRTVLLRYITEQDRAAGSADDR